MNDTSLLWEQLTWRSVRVRGVEDCVPKLLCALHDCCCRKLKDGIGGEGSRLASSSKEDTRFHPLSHCLLFNSLSSLQLTLAIGRKEPISALCFKLSRRTRRSDACIAAERASSRANVTASATPISWQSRKPLDRRHPPLQHKQRRQILARRTMPRNPALPEPRSCALATQETDRAAQAPPTLP